MNVFDLNNSFTTANIQVPVESIIDKMNEEIGKIAKSDKTREEKTEEIIRAVSVTTEERHRIEAETKEQSENYLWMKAREKRISASKCHRVIAFTNRTSGQVLVNEIIKPKSFSTAATQFGIQHEPLAITRYSEYREAKGENITVEKCGLVISLENGFLAASPDGVITEPNSEKGLLEVKVLPSWSDIPLVQACKNSKYPVKECTEIVNGKPEKVLRLKKSHQYYHQVQLQLYCCQHFAKFVDFVILHVNLGEMHIERIFPDLE